ncbi:MAG TPA: tetratricopeptide repeat protein [Blastocatellia bacterium]|nr:tetratricopeptide repeat protein [Blastocatellia bacterium]
MSLNKSKALRTAEKYVLQGKIPAAIDEYRKVVSADPGDLTTINTLGDLYVRAGRIQDAIANFSRIADSYREGGFTLKAIAMLKKISKLDPTNIDTSMKLANLYSQQGLLVEARQQYLQVADAYARAGQTRKALEAYQKIADLDPSNTSVRMKLGEIYSRESMTEQAHEAFIMAGNEFLRKGDSEQALNANLKAIVINPDSRQALTAIATIYTQQGQIDRAINILCEAFERNPGDVELLTILGRTYLSAGMMDDAERTFLSLVELDKNRYHYLLEVGRRFLQIGDLDRAAEQIDGSIEVLIAKREEDKAIDFLRRVLDRDINHVGALKRLAEIFLRIREDHNLIATLNSLVEAAMRNGEDVEAIAALKELSRLEPDEPLHLQRLYNLGVKDILDGDSHDVVRATGPLDYRSAVFDDAFVIRQISEAEILAGHGQVDHSVEILTEILRHAPENVQVHMKLKDIYLRAGIMDKAAEQCLELARIHDGRGESARASDFSAEARQLNPQLDSAPGESLEWEVGQAPPFVEELHAPASPVSSNGDGGFEVRDSPGVDWSSYQTGALADSFVTLPEELASSAGIASDADSNHHPVAQTGDGFRYSNTLIGDVSDRVRDGGPDDAAMFNSASLLPSDTMPRMLRDELEGIDFYIAQGYSDIARDTLDRLRDENGNHPEILARYKRLGVSLDSLSEAPDAEYIEPAPVEYVESNIADDSMNEAMYSPEVDDSASLQEESSYVSAGLRPSVEEAAYLSDAENESALEQDGDAEAVDKPFIIQKESGPLYPDLLVQLNTSDLLNQPAFEALRPVLSPPLAPVDQIIGTGDLIESIVSNIESTFDAIHRADEPVLEPIEPVAEPAAPVESESTGEESEQEPPSLAEPGPDAEQSREARSASDELREIFDELKEKTSDLKPLLDFETHYSLGLAYKDMDLLDDAISEFQMAFRTAGVNEPEGDFIQCCNMLGVCFKRKQMLKVAIMWFERGLKIPNRSEDEHQALRFEIGLCYEEMGEIDKALEVFTHVYGIDVNYRKVGEKIKELQAAKA